jgi:hypothetical protein
MRPTKGQWLVYTAVFALALAAVWSAEQPGGSATAHSTTQTSVAPVEVAVRSGAPGFPELDLTQLRDRMPRDPTEDLFTARTWREIEEEESGRSAPPLPPPPTPQAPPVPFAFIGKLVDSGITSIFLTKGDRNYVVRVGDMLDGNYRVEEIGEQSMTLAYLPLDARQSLAIGSALTPTAGSALVQGAATPDVPKPLAADASPTHDLRKLVWIAPSSVEIGEEFMIEVGLPAGREPRSGRVELVYDAMVLALLGGATGRRDASGGAAQRAVVDVIGPGFRGGEPTPSEVRFRVLAGRPTSTQIGIENLSATIATGGALVLESPRAHSLAVVEPAGAVGARR